MELFESFGAVSKYLPELFEKKDYLFWLVDQEKHVLTHYAGRQFTKVVEGDPLVPGGTPELVVRERRSVHRFVPAEVYGLPLKTVALPIPGGAVGVTFSVSEEESIQGSMKGIERAIDQMLVATAQVSTETSNLVTFMGTVLETLEEMQRNIQEIDQIGELIGEIAEDSRYISLNAAIEAHRAGEHGKTFAVVAAHMQKLSDQTQQSVRNISKQLDSTRMSFKKLSESLRNADRHLQVQSTHSNQITEELKGISSTVRENLVRIEKLL